MKIISLSKLYMVHLSTYLENINNNSNSNFFGEGKFYEGLQKLIACII